MINHKLAHAIDNLLELSVEYLASSTKGFSYMINLSLSSLNYTASLIHPVVLIVCIAFLLGVTNNRSLAVGSSLGLLFIWQVGLWEQMIQTVNLVFISSFLAITFGFCLGILGTRYKIFYSYVLSPILDIMQSMPSFVYLIPMIPFFGIGSVAGIFATVVFALPPVARLTCLGLTNIPSETLEAARAFGSTNIQTFFKVQLPLAIPVIVSGINQTIMMAISMIVVAAMVGAGGLGKDVLRAVDRLQFGQGVIAGFSVVIIAMILDRIISEISRRYNYRKIRPKMGFKEMVTIGKRGIKIRIGKGRKSL